MKKIELLAKTPIRLSAAIVALAIITSLSLHTLVNGIYTIEDMYSRIIVDQELQLANAGKAFGRSGEQGPGKHIPPSDTNQIIVKWKERGLPPGLSVAAEKANLENAQGLKKLLTIGGIGADVYQVSADDTAQEVVDYLRDKKRDVIEYAEVDMLIAPTYTTNDPKVSTSYHISKVQAPTAWDSTKGEGVTIAVLDTGVFCAHPDLQANCVPGWNTVSNNNDTADIKGHGTAVAGTAAAVGDNLAGAAGVAYNAKIMPIRITNDPGGTAYTSAMASAITWATDNGAKVINLSYGGCGVATFHSAATYARSKGSVVIFSAGNTGTDQLLTPSETVNCVSATGSTDTRPSWSSFGNYVDVSAPGANIYTTTMAGSYGGWNGTSFSAPITSAIYALMFSANPNLTPVQADNIIFSTADDIGEPGWDIYYGHGRVNASKAVAAAKATVGAQDTAAPSVPTNLRTTQVSSNFISLAWNPSTDDNSGVTGYSIYQNGSKIATAAGTTFNVFNLAPNAAYSFTVRAEDGAGNQSGNSNTLSTKTADIAFGIGSFSTTNKTSSGITVSTNLTKPGTVTVKYGTSATSLTQQVVSGSAATSQSVTLSGLTANTTYYYQIVATDGTNTVTSAVSSFMTSKATGGSGGGKPRR